MIKTIIIIGAGREQIRAYEIAKSMGLRVVGTDMDNSAPGFDYADEKLICSTRDVEETVNEVRKLSRKDKLDGVMTIGNDAAHTVSAVAELIKTPGISVNSAVLASDKMQMKKRFNEFDVETPKHFIIENKKSFLETVERLKYPLVLKPSDGRGSRGVLFLESDMDLESAYEYSLSNSKSKILLLEEFIEGDQLSVEGIFVNKKYHAVAYADRNYLRLKETKPFIIEDGGVIPSKYSGKILDDIRDCIEKASLSLGIDQGPVKADVVLSDTGPMIIELAARLSGNYLASHHLRWALGIDIVKSVIKYSLGEDITDSDLIPTKSKFLAARYFFPQPGYIKSIKGVESLKNDHRVKKIEIYRKVGDYQPRIEANIDRAGIIRCLGDSIEEVTSFVEQASNKVTFEVN